MVASSSRLDDMPGLLKAEGNLLPRRNGFCTNIGKGCSSPEGNREEMLMNERTARVEIIRIWMLRKTNSGCAGDFESSPYPSEN